MKITHFRLDLKMHDLTTPDQNEVKTGQLLVRDPAEKMLRTRFAEADLLAAEPANAMNASAVLHAFRRNWLLGAVLGLFLAVPLAAGVWVVVQPKFEAMTLIRISPQHEPLAFETADRSGGAGHLDFRNFKNTQRQLLLSPQLLTNALRRNGVADLLVVREKEDPILWLQDKLDITFPDEAEIMTVSLKLADGAAARKIVDAVVDTYYEDVVLADQNERLRRIDNLERVRSEAEAKTRTRRAELQSLGEAMGTTDVASMSLAQQASMQHYSLIRAELTKTHYELIRAESEYQSLLKKAERESLNGSPSSERTKGKSTQDPVQVEMRVSQLLESDPVGFHNLREAWRYGSLIHQAESNLVPEKAAKLLPGYRQKLKEAEKIVNRRKQELRELLELNEEEVAEELKEEDPHIDELSHQVEALKKQKAQMEAELALQEQESKKIGRSSVDAEMMLQEVSGMDKVVVGINDELERTKIELKSKSRISILGPAQIPQIGDAKKRLPMTAAAGLFGLCSPLLLLMAFDLKRQLVNGRETMTEVIRMPVLGSLPRIPQRVLRRVARSSRSRTGVWMRRLDESVSAITSLLLHKLDQEGHRIVLVTSAASGEGKSTLVAHLAASLAESGHSTLLIDFDLRRPTLHRYFNVPMKPGVTDVLRGGTELEQAVQATNLPNLRLLTAGSLLGGSLLQDASNGSLKALFVNARANYEIVLVDSCPLLPVMDGRLVGQYTDGAVLSVIKDVSKLPQITAACNIMADYGIPTFGCVVMGDTQSHYYSEYASSPAARPVGV